MDSVETMEDIDEPTKREVIHELKREKTFRIMACGLTGVGKSTLLNGIAGKDVFPVGDFEPETFEVDKYPEKKENFELILYDTPGFEDATGNEEEYLEKIITECADVDTLIYCISLNVTRIRMERDLATLKKLKLALNDRVWESCVIVLTFANSVVDKIKVKGIVKAEDIKEEFDKRVKAWEKKVLETFSAAGIDPSVNNIPIAHAGIATAPLLFESDSLPWLSILWQAINDKSPPDGQAVLFRFNVDRFTDIHAEKSEGREVPLAPLHKQKIVIENTFIDKLKDKYPTATKALAAGGVAGATGAGVGAIVGGIFFGIPTFGGGIALGAVLGGLIGGGLGVGAGAAGVTAVKKIIQYKKKEKKVLDS